MDELKKYLQENRSALDLDEPGPMGWEKVQAKLHQERPAAKVVTIKKYFQWSVAACVIVLAGIGLWSLLDTKPESLKQQVLNSPNTSNQSAGVGADKQSEVPADHAAENGITTVTNNRNEDFNSVSNMANSGTTPIANSNKKYADKDYKPSSKSLTNEALASLASVENGFTQVINLQRGKISTTPMYAESAAYFNEFKMQIQQIEADEKQLKKEISKKGLTANQLDQLIDLYQYKLTVLKQLQLEMNKTNNRFKQNRGPVDSTRAYFINI